LAKWLWGTCSVGFWTGQFIESFYTTTYDCISHVTDTSSAIAELEKLRIKAPRVDFSITNYHYKEVYDANRRLVKTNEKIITGGEHRNFKFDKWTDSSLGTSFLKECKTTEQGEVLKPMTRLVVGKDITMSP
jgi:hypothetical protein